MTIRKFSKSGVFKTMDIETLKLSIFLILFNGIIIRIIYRFRLNVSGFLQNIWKIAKKK